MCVLLFSDAMQDCKASCSFNYRTLSQVGTGKRSLASLNRRPHRERIATRYRVKSGKNGDGVWLIKVTTHVAEVRKVPDGQETALVSVGPLD